MLTIQTTGLEDYLDGGTAKAKLLLAGGPGAGKTRFAGFTPRPFYAACEDGMMSVADLRVPYAAIKSEEDMNAFLDIVEAEAKQPEDKRRFETVIIDTLDAYERTVTHHYLVRKRQTELDGWEDYGYLASRMNNVITRLMQVPFNVVICVHTKDKQINKRDVTNLKLTGDLRNQLPADFDFVGLLENDWDLVDGKRGLKRHIRWEPTPEADWLKCRGGALSETPVVFARSDYDAIWNGIRAQVEALAAQEQMQQVTVHQQDSVVAPAPGGPVQAPVRGAHSAPPAAPPVAPAAPAPVQPPAQPAAPAATSAVPPAPAAVPPAPAVASPPPAAPRPDAGPPPTMTQGVNRIKEALGGNVIQDSAGELAPRQAEQGDGGEANPPSPAPEPSAVATSPAAQPEAEAAPPSPAPLPATPAAEPAPDVSTPVAGPEPTGTSVPVEADPAKVVIPDNSDGFMTVVCGQARYTGGSPRQHVGVPTGCGKELSVLIADARVTEAQGDEQATLIEIAGMRERAFLHNACYGSVRQVPAVN